MAKYALGIQEAYLYGRMGAGFDQISVNGYAAELNAEQRKTAYNYGVIAGKVESRSKQAQNASRGRSINKDGKVIYDGVNLKGRKLNEQQKAGIKLAEFLAASGLNVHVYESYKGSDGKWHNRFGGANGVYTDRNGDIYIDLNAGDNGEGTMAYTICQTSLRNIRCFPRLV